MVSMGQKLAKPGKSDVLSGVGGHNSNLHKDRIASQYHAKQQKCSRGGRGEESAATARKQIHPKPHTAGRRIASNRTRSQMRGRGVVEEGFRSHGVAKVEGVESGSTKGRRAKWGKRRDKPGGEHRT